MKNPRNVHDVEPLSRKFRIGWVAACACGALLGLGIHFPATGLASVVESQSRGALRLTDAKGSIWNGSAGLEYAGDGGSGFAWPDRVSWSWGWASGAPELKMSSKSCARGLALRVGWSGGAVGAFECALPASALSAASGPWGKMKYGGRALWASEGLAMPGWSGSALAGSVKLRLSDLCLELSQACPLGSYVAVARLDGGKATLTLASDAGSALDVSGSGEFGGSGSRFDAVAKADPKEEARMANMLAMIGDYRGGESKISWRAGPANRKQ